MPASPLLCKKALIYKWEREEGEREREKIFAGNERADYLILDLRPPYF